MALRYRILLTVVTAVPLALVAACAGGLGARIIVAAVLMAPGCAWGLSVRLSEYR